MVFTNDRSPRAINPDGSLKAASDWTLSETRVKTGASIGAGAIIVCGVTIGKWAMIGAGAVVTRDVPDYGLVYGNPARLRGFVSPYGHKMTLKTRTAEGTLMVCPQSGLEVVIPHVDYTKLTADD
jgi:hypothetical protein